MGRRKRNARGAVELFDNSGLGEAANAALSDDMLATATSSLLGPPEKRPRLAATELDELPRIDNYTGITSEVEDLDASVHPISDGYDVPIFKSLPQGASRYMNEFQEYFPLFHDFILAAELHPLIGKPCCCGRDTALRTCICNECTFYEPTCSECFISNHKCNPWHWAEVWNGDFFDRKDISELGHIITFGHDGSLDRCPYNKSASGLEFILVDITGVHQTKVQFCQCIGKSTNRVHHLLQAKVFPASTGRPSMGFTFNLLRDFHHHTLTSKKSAYDYIAAIRRKSSNAFTEDVPDPYRQFLHVKRVWIALSALRRSGQVHSIDKYLPYRSPGSVIVPCFGCPEPGFNVPNEQWEVVEDDFRHINMLYLMEDGHFGLQRYAKADDPEDVALLGGAGFFPDDATYNEYVENVVANAEEKSSCSKFNAILMQNMLKFKGCVITGVIACECGRHCMFLSEVDLQKGERFANADYALSMALSRYIRWFREKKSLGDAKYFFKHILLTYDVACQYYKNLRERFTSHFPNLVDIIDIVHALVPKMHLDGHKDECKVRFSLNYFKGAGRSHGEGIEASWAETKQCGGSTRQMNHGHRHDTLTDFHNFWNWKKLQGMSMSLKTHLISARKSLSEHVSYFHGLSLQRGPDIIRQWDSESTAPVKQNGEWISVYNLHLDKLPGQEEVYQSFENLENRSKRVGAPQLSPNAQVINWGINLQRKQRELKQIVKFGEINETDLHRRRQTLANEMERWRTHQRDVMPNLHGLINEVEMQVLVEDEKLHLPSDFAADRRYELGIVELAQIELQLREGEANGAVTTICNAVIHQILLRENKSRHSAGVVQNLRSQKHIDRIRDKRTLAAGDYRHARKSLLALHGVDEHNEFPALEESHMWPKNAAGARELGDGSNTDSWIWTYGRLRGMTDTEKENFLLATEKVQWFRVKADTERWIEEVEILEEEFRRFIRSCQRMDAIWSDMANAPPTTLLFTECYKPNNILVSGYKVYAFQKAAMYRRMGAAAEVRMADAGGSWPLPEETICDHLRARRLQLRVDWDSED